MKIPRKGPLWAIVIGIPQMFIAIIGCMAILFGWDWLDQKCRRWFLELGG